MLLLKESPPLDPMGSYAFKVKFIIALENHLIDGIELFKRDDAIGTTAKFTYLGHFSFIA